jgi:hypothetical protein
VHAHLIEGLGCRHRPAVIAEQGFALGVQGFEHVFTVTAGAETEAGAQLPLEDVEERAPGVATGAALGLGEGPL